jgi:hypothetical protein
MVGEGRFFDKKLEKGAGNLTEWQAHGYEIRFKVEDGRRAVQ